MVSEVGTSHALLAALLCALVGGCSNTDGLDPNIDEELGVPERSLGVGDFVSIESYNNPGLYIRHSYNLGELTQVISWQDKADATFKLVPGLANSDCVSFESSNFPGYYFRHQTWRIKLQPWASDDLYRNDATFCIRPSIQPGAGTPWVSFESYNHPGYYIRHRNGHLYAENQGGPFRSDATFALVNPL
jgi:hypothetical protein